MKENPEIFGTTGNTTRGILRLGIIPVFLVALGLSGGVTMGTTVEWQEKVDAEQEALLLSIEEARTSVKMLLEENEARIRDAKRNEISLIKKADFYSKPVYPSTQVFFAWFYEEAGKGKNNNREEWKNTLNAIGYRLAGGETPKGKNPYSAGEVSQGYMESTVPVPDAQKDPNINGDGGYKAVWEIAATPAEVGAATPSAGSAVTENAVKLTFATTGATDPMDVLQSGNGVFIEQEPYVEEVELGANIKPLNPTLPDITKSVNVSVQLPTIATISGPNPPTIPVVPSPTVTPVSVNAPSPVAAITIEPPEPQTPTPPGAPEITVPVAPTIAEFTPVTVTPPSAPDAPAVSLPTLPKFSIDANKLGSNSAAFFLKNNPTLNNQNTVISEIAITGGTFTATRTTAAGGFTYSTRSYTGYNFYGAATTGETGTIRNAATSAVITGGSVANNTAVTIDDVTNATTTTAAIGMMRPLDRGLWNNGNWTYTYGGATGVSGDPVRELVHYDVHNGLAMNTFKGRLASAGASVELQDSFQFAENMAGNPGTVKTVQFVNSGFIDMIGSNITFTNQYMHTTGVQIIHMNDGKILVEQGNYNTVFMMAKDNSGGGNDGVIMYNGPKGEITINTGSSAAFAFGNQSNNAKNPAHFGNDGLIVLAGDSGSGIYVAKLENAATPTNANSKITLHDDPEDRGYGNDTGMLYVMGDKSLGIYIPKNVSKGVFSGTNQGIRIAVGGYDSGKFASANVDGNLTENAVGMAIKAQSGPTTVALDYHEIHVNGNSKNSVGAISLANAGLNFIEGTISVNGGEGNIGVFTGKLDTDEDNNISTTTPDDNGSNVVSGGSLIAGNGKVNQNWSGPQDGTGITISAVAIEGGDDPDGFGGSETFVAPAGSTYAVTSKYQSATGTDVNIVAYAKDGNTITAANLGGMGSQNTVGLYAEGASSEITISNDVEIIGMTVTDGSSNAIAAFAKDGGKITLKNTRLGSSGLAFPSDNRAILDKYPDIDITGAKDASGKYAGIGLFAQNGGTINANPTAPGINTGLSIRVSEGGAGVAAIKGTSGSSGSTINIKGATIYVDNGYAIYVEPGSGSSVDFTDGTIVLAGKDIDGVAGDDISGTAFEVVIGGTSPITTSGNTRILVTSDRVVALSLKASGATTLSTINTSISGLVTIEALPGINKWKLGALDSINTLTIDVAVTDDASIVTNSVSDQWFHRLIPQNSQIVVNADMKVSVDASHLTTYGETSVIGITGTAAQKTGLTINDTGITINSGKTVTAERTDTGVQGAVGALINYGKLSNAGTIDVEQLNGNDGGIGVLAIDGSKADNAGMINVNGKKGAGMAAMAYRTGVGPAFGLADEGETEIKNSGTINATTSGTAAGEGAIGLYLSNNSMTEGATATMKAENAGTVDVSGKYGVGIVAVGTGTGADSEVSNTGTIKVGEEGAGIFLSKAAKITGIAGTMELANKAIGVIVDPKSVFDAGATGTATFKALGTVTNAIGFVFKSDTTALDSSTTQTFDVDITNQDIEGFTSLYVLNRDEIVSQGDINVLNKGVGIYLDNGAVNNAGDITLDSGNTDSGIGIYTANGSVTNSGDIDVDGVGGIGIVAKGSTADITNTGTITLLHDETTGIYITDGAVLPGTGTVVFGSGVQKSFGVVASNAEIDFTAAASYTLANGDGNTLVYGEKGTLIKLQNNVSIDGVAAVVSPAKPTVGFYLDGTNGANTIDGGGYIYEVKNGIIGIYAIKINTIKNIEVDVTDEQGVGIYFADSGNLENITLTVDDSSTTDNSIGIYVAAGTIAVSGSNSITLGRAGTDNISIGAYLTNGAQLSGSAFTVSNLTDDTSNPIFNPAFYYTRGTFAGEATHGTDITIAASSEKMVAIFADVGDPVAALGDFKFANTKTITDNSDGSIGVLASADSAGTYRTIFTNKSSGSIIGNGSDSVGVYVSGKADVINEGNITVSNSTASGTGVMMEGNDSTFDNTTGTISVGDKGVGISLLNVTAANRVKHAGNISLGANSIGVYAENSLVDFDAAFLGTATQGVGVFAKAGSIITGNLNAGSSQHTIALYLYDNTIALNNLEITTGDVDASSNPSIGMYIGETPGAPGTEVYNIYVSKISVPHADTIGIYVKSGNELNFHDTILDVGAGAIGVLGENLNTKLIIHDVDITIHGAGQGIVVTDNAALTISNLDVTFDGTGGILALAADATSTITLGSNINVTGKGSIAATTNGSLVNSGTLSAGEKGVGLLGVYTLDPGTPVQLKNDAGAVINVDTGATGIAIVAGTSAPATISNVTAVNDGKIYVKDLQNKGSVGIYAERGHIKNGYASVDVVDGGIGIYAKDTTVIDDGGKINVSTTSATTANSAVGVGYLIEGSGVTIATPGTVDLNAGTADKLTIGAYLLDAASSIDPLLMTINQNGNYSAQYVVDTSAAATYSSSAAVAVSGSLSNAIGVISLNDATLSVPSIQVDGDNNIGGVGAQGGSISVSGNVETTGSTASTGNANGSVGVFVEGGGTATINGTLTAGANTIGAISQNANVTVDELTAKAGSVGIYGSGSGTLTAGSTASDVIDVQTGALGVFAKDSASVDVTGTMNVAEGLSVGIVSTGTGNVDFDGTATVDDKASKASIAIYKAADKSGNSGGTVTVAPGSTLNVGQEGYGLYVENSGGSGTVTVNNAGTVVLGTSAVGIYANGAANVANTGNITVGDTFLGNPADHEDMTNWLNSVGIYGGDGAVITNSGAITVTDDHSVGAYVTGATFTNAAGGTITADGGGVGILAVNNSTIVNQGTITTGYVEPTCDGQTVGVGLYKGSTLVNDTTGVINVGAGAGVYVANMASVNNKGIINVDNGTGIQGPGTIINAGTIIVSDANGDGVTGSAQSLGGAAPDPARNGAIAITNDGKVIINDQYTHVGGTLVADHIVGAGAIVNIVDAGNTPLFVANTIEGKFTLASEFAKTGNGYSWKVDNFFSTVGAIGGLSGTIAVTASPLFMTHLLGNTGAVAIAKQPYAYLVAGEQFDNLYNGVDSLLALDQAGIGNDSTILKGLNAYLDTLYNNQGMSAFVSETDRTLAEMRGDIYATIHRRVANINDAFGRAWDELESAYNFTRETGKWSVIHGRGSYEDPTIGIDDYDYYTTGLLYMKEYDGRNYDDKWGWSLGFAVSRFDFDDAPTFGDKSEEDVYSVRAGLHTSLTLGERDDWKLRTKLELGYNRHEATRTLELDKVYKNDAGYDVWGVTLENRLSKKLYESLTTDFSAYGELKLGYYRIMNFTESSKTDVNGNYLGGLELDIRNKDYLQITADIGLKGSKRFYLGKKLSAKLTGDLSYGYEFGNADKRYTKARVSGGTEDWYNLIRPSEEKGRIKATLGLTFERANRYGLTFDVEARKHDAKSSADLRFNARLTYKFMN